MLDGGMAKTEAPGILLSPRVLSVSERLEQEQMTLEKRLQEINEALTILRESPQIQRVIDVVTRVARY